MVPSGRGRSHGEVITPRFGINRNKRRLLSLLLNMHASRGLYSVNFQKHRRFRGRERQNYGRGRYLAVSLEIWRTAISETRHNADLYYEIRASAGYARWRNVGTAMLLPEFPVSLILRSRARKTLVSGVRCDSGMKVHTRVRGRKNSPALSRYNFT